MKKLYIVLLISILIFPLLGCEKKENKQEENTPIADSGEQKVVETHEDGIYTCLSKKLENMEFKEEYTIKDNKVIFYKTTLIADYKEIAEAMYQQYKTLDLCHNLTLNNNVVTYTNDDSFLINASFSELQTFIKSNKESYDWKCE